MPQNAVAKTTYNYRTTTTGDDDVERTEHTKLNETNGPTDETRRTNARRALSIRIDTDGAVAVQPTLKSGGWFKNDKNQLARSIATNSGAIYIVQE